MNEDEETPNELEPTPIQTLAVRPAPFVPLSFERTMQLAEVLARSGFFTSAKTAAQAAVKIMAGAEYGIQPVIAMQNVYVIDGKTALSDVLIGMLIDGSDRYDYRILVTTNRECQIAFYRDNKLRGTEIWTMDDATTAGLNTKDNWRKYPKAMLYARTISSGTKKFIPGVLRGGAVYIPDELGDDAPEYSNALRTNPFTDDPDGAEAGAWREVAPALLTPTQRDTINRAFTQLGWNAPKRGAWLREGYGASLAQLTEIQANEALTCLDDLLHPSEPETTEIEAAATELNERTE